MTEETLNIQIKANVQQAVDSINKVKKDIKDIGKDGGSSAKGIDKVTKSLNDVKKASGHAKQGVEKAMGGIKKSVLSAVKAVATLALATASLSEGMEFGKLQGKLNAAFQSAGSSAAQATKTFKELYRFLGDSDRAVETAQNLARVTTSEKELAEWTKILQGVYATMGDAIPVETLAESVNETAQVAKVTGTLADALNWMGISEDAVNNKLATMNTAHEREAYLRSLLNGLYSNAAAIYEHNSKAMLDYNQAQANLKIQLADVATKIMPLITAFSNMAAVVLGVLKPAIEVIVQVIATLCQWIIAAINWLGAFFGIFSDGKASVSNTNNSINKATNSMNNYAGAIGGAAAAAKELKKQTMGFDELNIVQSPTATGGGGGGGGGSIAAPNVDIPKIEMPNFDDFNASLEDSKKKIEGLLVLIAGVATGIGLWKLINFIGDLITASKTAKGLGMAMGKVGSIIRHKVLAPITMIAGGILLAIGYTDAWANGISWANLAETIGGLALIITSLGLSFGSFGASIGVIVGGVALLVLGIKDLIENGYSMEGVITVLIGAVAAFLGVILLVNTALLASPITWIVVGIMALVAAFVVLWNECEGFRNFWINLWETVSTWVEKTVKNIVDWFKQAWVDIKNAFNTAISWIKEKIIQPIADFYNKWIRPVIEKIIEIITKCVEIIISLYVGLYNLLVDKIIKPIAEWVSKTVGNIKDWIKGAVDTIKGWFSDLWNKIKEIFSPVANFFKEIWNKAYNAVKTVFSPIVNFFGGIWDKIKNKFSKLGTSIGDAISSAVKSGINGVISLIERTINKAIGLINGAIKLINLLPGVSVSYVKKLSMPRLAKGGIVDSATIAMVGEQGKEAVVPLENNTEWMDKLADRLAARMASPTRVSLNVDGKELGWATINSINNITKQSGNLPLAVM